MNDEWTMGFREFCFFTPFRAKLKIDFAFDFDKIMNQNKAKQFQIAYSRTLQGHVDYQWIKILTHLKLILNIDLKLILNIEIQFE